jgi:hypothetical protein
LDSAQKNKEPNADQKAKTCTEINRIQRRERIEMLPLEAIRSSMDALGGRDFSHCSTLPILMIEVAISLHFY